MDVSEPPGGYWEPNLGLLQEQSVLLTSGHLSSPKYYLLDCGLRLQRRGIVSFHFVLFLFFFFGGGGVTGSHYVDQTDLEPKEIHLLLPTKCWD